MTENYPAMVIIIPLIFACMTAISLWLNRRLCFSLALIALLSVLFSAIALFIRVLEEGHILYRLGGWDPPWGIVYYIDRINGAVLVVIALAATLNLISGQRLIERDLEEKSGSVYTLYLLCVAGLLGMVITGDVFNLYVLLEIASLSGYALIALGGKNAARASLNYVFMGTIGASFYLLGIGFLYTVTGTLNMANLAAVLPDLYKSQAVLTAFIMIMAGLWLKMALFPLHGWLPNAYSFAPPPVTGMLAPLTTKVMIYVMIRLLLTVFTPEYAYQVRHLKLPVELLASAAVIAGAILALQQREIKRMLAYIIVSEVGYMVGGAWLGNSDGMTGAILHLLNDAVMTLCVFSAVSAMSYRLNDLKFKNLNKLFTKMPWTMCGFTIGAMSIIGIPPTSGFFSKWYLLKGAMEAERYEFAVALIISSLVGVILFFRIFESAIFSEGDSDVHADSQDSAVAMAEAPAMMVIPLLITAAVVIFMGIYSNWIVTRVIKPIMISGLYWGG